MKKILLTLLLAALTLPAAAQFPMEQFPNYKDFSIPKPDRDTRITRDDLRLTDKFLPLYPEGLPIASQQDLYKLYAFFRDTPEGQAEWREMQDLAVSVISSWNIRHPSGFGAARYIKSLLSLTPLSKVYVFTGNELLSLFIRGHLKKMQSLPLDFWVHAELRGLNPERPVGGLETAANDQFLSFALAAVGKDMTTAERKAFEKVWYTNSFRPTRNWLDTFRPNNWTAAVATGLMYSATYFNDREARQRALDGIKYYCSHAFCADGSYAEGYGYMDYPIRLLYKAALVMSPDEIREVFGNCPLKDSMKWRIYGHLFDIEPDGTPGVMRISYGDNPYGNRELKGMDGPGRFCELVYGDRCFAWLRSKYGTLKNSDSILLEAKLGTGDAVPQSPAQAGLPLVRAFQSGDCFIRSDWGDEGTVFALKAGDGGSQVGFAHNRPELQNIALGAFGEYFIVTTGSASYRSRLHNEYDVCTLSANTITVDGMNQKYHGEPSYKKGRWDNRAVWVKGDPHAVVTRCEALPDGNAILKSEATDAYHIEMKEAARSVFYVREGNFFLVRDVMKPVDGVKHRFDYRLHINNRDGKTIVSGKPGALKLERPKADLYIALKSAAKLDFIQEDGYMHGPLGRDYDENGPMQGKPGSAITLDWQSDAKALDICAVLYPRRHGEPAPKIRFGKGKVTVDGKTYTIPE